MKGRGINLFVVSVILFGLVGCTSNSKVNDIKLEPQKNQAKETTPSISENNQGVRLRQLEEEARSHIPRLKELTKDFYSDITVATENDNKLVYTYTYKNKEETKIKVDDLKPALTEQVAPIMKEVKRFVPDFRIEFVYLNSNKKEVGRILISESDIGAVSNSTTK